MHVSHLFALVAALPSSLAAYRGFNYASDGRDAAAFEGEFNAAKSLAGSNFTSARLYTMIQDGTHDTGISAIQAAIKTRTSLLLGLWASAGEA